jgi:general secretion pathway protein F
VWRQTKLSTVEYNLLEEKIVRKQRTDNGNNLQTKSDNPFSADLTKRVNQRDVCRLTRQLAILLRAGMPLLFSLEALTEQLREGTEGRFNWSGRKDAFLANVMEDIAISVDSGSSLAASLSKHPEIFPDYYVGMIAAGEESGNLEQVLLHLADMLEKRLNTSAKVKSALAYPAVMVVVAGGVVGFLLGFVVPDITRIFVENNQPLPWPTHLLISISSFVKTFAPLMIVLTGVALFAAVAAYKTKQGRLLADRWKLKMPLFGSLLLKLEIARMSRMLGIMLASGIPILNALQIVKKVVHNSLIADSIDRIRDVIGKGDTIANAVKKTRLFPPIISHILSTGQASGDIETSLLSIADMYDNEIEITAKTLTTLLEPAILLVMGVVVAFIVLAVLLPIFQISQVL